MKHYIPMRNLKRPDEGRESLERLMRWPGLRRHIGDTVRIYSREHNAYWRQNACGYTIQRDEAGIYTLDDAIARTRHCGPEKRIQYERVASNAS